MSVFVTSDVSQLSLLLFILLRCRLGHKSKLYCAETFPSSSTVRATCAQCFNSWKNFLVCKSNWLYVYSKITELSLAQKIFSSSVKQIEWKTFSVCLRNSARDFLSQLLYFFYFVLELRGGKGENIESLGWIKVLKKVD